MEKKLIRVSTYASSIGKTTQWVYSLIKSGKLVSEKIDGAVFVVVEETKSVSQFKKEIR